MLGTKLRREDYYEIVGTLAETAFLIQKGRVGEDPIWEANEDDFYDEIDRLIPATRILVTEAPYVMALSDNYNAFWEEVDGDDMDKYLSQYEEDVPAGNLISMMAYYALQADVIAAVKVLTKAIDITSVIA